MSDFAANSIAIVIICIFVILPGMVMYFLTRNREATARAAGDPAMNAKLVDIAERLDLLLGAVAVAVALLSTHSELDGSDSNAFHVHSCSSNGLDLLEPSFRLCF